MSGLYELRKQLYIGVIETNYASIWGRGSDRRAREVFILYFGLLHSRKGVDE